jgi:phospholipase C
MGFRTPAVSVSPYTTGGKSRRGFRVDHGVYGHESILKLISYRFGIGYLNKRHRYTRNIGRSFDWDNPDFTPPKLPDPPQVASTLCSTGGGSVFGETHANDLADLEALAHRFGVPVLDGKTHQIFREPDKLRRAHARAQRHDRHRR